MVCASALSFLDGKMFATQEPSIIIIFIIIIIIIIIITPQWGAADAEIKVPSGENIELKRSPS